MYWQEKCDVFVFLQLKLGNYWDKLFPSSNTLEYKNIESILPIKFNWGESLLQGEGVIERVNECLLEGLSPVRDTMSSLKVNIASPGSLR